MGAYTRVYWVLKKDIFYIRKDNRCYLFFIARKHTQMHGNQEERGCAGKKIDG